MATKYIYFHSRGVDVPVMVIDDELAVTDTGTPTHYIDFTDTDTKETVSVGVVNGKLLVETV